jgi:hypothetical protein
MAEEDFKEGFIQFWNSAVYFIFDIVSFDISSNCRHFNGSPLLCPINATSSFSYVFRLHYPRVLHCRIVPIQKLKTLFVLGRKKPPIIVVLSEFKKSNLKITRKFANWHLVGYLTGGWIFSRNVCSPPQQPNYKMYYIIDDKNTQIVSLDLGLLVLFIFFINIVQYSVAS